METFSKDVIENRIVFTWRNALESSKDVQKTVTQSFKFFGTPKGSFFLTRDGINGFDSIIADLKEYEDVGQKFSDRYLEHTVSDMIVELLPVKEKNIVSKVRQATTQLLATLVQPATNWIVIVPITNLIIRMKFLDIGTVRFSKFSKKARRKILSAARKQARSILQKDLLPKYANKIVALAHVSAVDDTRALERGLEAIEDAIDVLRFYRLGSAFRSVDISRNNIDIDGRIHEGIEVALCLRNPPKIDYVCPITERTGPLFPLEITTAHLKAMRKDGLNLLNSILKKAEKNRTDLESRIITAVRFCALSTYNGSNTNSFVNSAVSLEALLLVGSEAKSGNLAERVALTMGKNLSERNWLFDQMIKIYKKRSSIVHAGNIDVTHSDLRLFQLINYGCVVRLLKLSKKQNFSKISDLVRWVRCRKFR